MSNPNLPKPKPKIIPKPWQRGLGPYYIGLFLWIVFFDQLGMRALPVGGVGWSFLGAVLAGPLCYLLLFRVPSLWGFATGKPLTELACSTFGVGGARWVPGLLVGLAEVVWFAVAVSYGTDLTLKGLSTAKLIDPGQLKPIVLGAMTLKSPLFLATSLFWSVAAALVGRWFVRLVAAIMYVYPIFPAMVFGGAMLAMMGGIRYFAPTGIDPLGLIAIPESRAGIWSMMLVIQMIFSFFAMAGATGADWGAATSTERDVRVGGWIAVGLAPIVIAAIALVTIAGFQGRLNAPTVSEFSPDDSFASPLSDPSSLRRLTNFRSSTSQIVTLGKPPEATFRAVMSDGIGGRLGCAMLMIVGVAALAPAVYSAFVFGQRLQETLPTLSKTRWTLIGAFVAWPMVAFGIVDRLEVVFSVMGALFAPLVACLAAEYAIHRGIWPGPRSGVNRPGMIGWVAGVLVGLIPLLRGRFASFQPAAFWAFLAAFAVYRIVAKFTGEAQVAPVAEAQLAESAI
jgi:cytosine permease